MSTRQIPKYQSRDPRECPWDDEQEQEATKYQNETENGLNHYPKSLSDSSSSRKTTHQAKTTTVRIPYALLAEYSLPIVSNFNTTSQFLHNTLACDRRLRDLPGFVWALNSALHICTTR